jgi:hypothetical protein
MYQTLTKLLTKLLLSFSSFSGVLYFYVVVRQDFPFLKLSTFGIKSQDTFLLRNGMYVVVFYVAAYITLLLTKKVFKSGETLAALEEKPIESVAVPTYIGLFVIAIGLQPISNSVSLIVLAVLFLFWTRLEKIFYFNPIWLFFGYRFYEVKSTKGNTYTLVTKQDRLKGKQSFDNLRRINEYTYLETK